MQLRIFCTVFLLISVCAFPLFFTLAIGLFSVIWFRKYYELIPLYFLNDVLHAVPLSRYFHFSYVMTILAIVLVLGSNVIRKNLFTNE